jgi:hypothetical protein
MKKSLGMACAASAVAVLVGWSAIAGVAGLRDAKAQEYQQFGQAAWQQPQQFGMGYGMQDYGIPRQPERTAPQQFQGQPGFGQQQAWGPGQTQPWQQHAWGGAQFQQPGLTGQPQLHAQPWQQPFHQPGPTGFGQHGPGFGATLPGQQFGQLGMAGPQMIQPGITPMQHPTLQLMQAAEQLRQSIRTLAQQHPTPERDRAINAAERALWQANQATMAVAALAPPPPMAFTVYGPDGRPVQHQQFWGAPGIGATGMAGPQFHQPQFQQPQVWGQPQFQQPQGWGQPGQQQFWGDPAQQRFGGAG